MSEIDGSLGKYLLCKTGTRAIQMGHNANEMAFRFVAISWQIYSSGKGAGEKGSAAAFLNAQGANNDLAL